jgi:hypothetical protein
MGRVNEEIVGLCSSWHAQKEMIEEMVDEVSLIKFIMFVDDIHRILITYFCCNLAVF